MEDFKSIQELPIRGGWGYTQDDAVIIDKNDPILAEGQPFDGAGIEYVFVEKRIYEELIIFRPKGEQHSGIKWELIKQRLIPGDDGRHFDMLEFRVTAVPDQEWNRLKAEWEGPNGIANPAFDESVHKADRERNTVTYTAVYWFDITSYF